MYKNLAGISIAEFIIPLELTCETFIDLVLKLWFNYFLYDSFDLVAMLRPSHQLCVAWMRLFEIAGTEVFL